MISPVNTSSSGKQQYEGGMLVRWSVCMASSFIGVFCICILWLRYWLPAFEYRTCLADGLHNGYIDQETYAQYWLPKTVTPCIAGNNAIWSDQYIQQMGMLPMSNYAAFIPSNRRLLLKHKQEINSPADILIGDRYAGWCQSETLFQCDPYYLHLLYTTLICFACTICCLYSILTINIFKEETIFIIPGNIKFRSTFRNINTNISRRKINFRKMDVIVEEKEDQILEIDF